ncbi:MAG: hypothetical protein R3B70_21665 [Polyangiaceae bacterium]
MTLRKSLAFRSFVVASALAITAFLASASGCSLLTKTDRNKIDEGGAAGAGGGGTGGTGTAGTSSIGGGGSGGTGGATCTSECCSPSDCPASDNECVQRTCDGGVCGTKPVKQGVPISLQEEGDCRLVVCDGNGGVASVADNTDLPDDGKQCTIDKCQSGTPVNTSAPAGEACDEGIGKKCDGSGACAECLAPSDCASKVCTVEGACAPAECGDGVKNGDETDTDCGGVCGATCAPGKVCAKDGDCDSHVCDRATLKCAAPSCSDTIKNGDESDVDCGGACGPTCGPGKSCGEDLDCKGELCSGSFCLPSCIDGVKNNSETGLDCGGPVCTSTCDDGTFCVVPSDCTSGFCVDAVCCDTACDDTCSACSAAAKGEGDDGACGFAPQGTDPHDDCGISASDTCGDATGLCDGAGVCEQWPAGTACGDAASCASGIQTNADACNGLGQCADQGTVVCAPFACGPSECNDTCAGDADCAADAFCENTVCVAKKPLAAACGGANECASGSCADGLCCDDVCAGSCKACSVVAGGQTDGTCTPTAAGQDPAGDCGGTGLCDGNGGCKKNNGQACILGTECLSGNCADGFCCNTPCVGLCQACSNLKKGSGANGSCGFVGVGVDPDDECAGATSCSGGGTCSLFPLGAACALNGECQSGFCVDGNCCNTACQGFCQACSTAKTGLANGTCDDIVAGTDPDDECAGAEVCDGNLGCQP